MKRTSVCVEVAPNQAHLRRLNPTNTGWNRSRYITSNTSKVVASCVSHCELILAAAAGDKAPVLHSFQMSAGRRGAAESRVTAGGEISGIRRQEEVEQGSGLKEELGRVTDADTVVCCKEHRNWH